MKHRGLARMVDLAPLSSAEGERVFGARVPDFRAAVFSWNIVLMPSAQVTLGFAVRARGAWSERFDLAVWSAGPERRSFPKQADAFGALDVDVFTPAEDRPVDEIRVWVRGPDAGAFQVHALVASLRLRGPDAHPSGATLTTRLPEARVEVPPLVQFPVPEIGARICSPTSCAMLLGALGHAVSPRQLADAAWDSGADIYGNWSMNMAASARPGVRAWVQHFEHVGQLAERAARGLATAVSVRTSQETGFSGALQTYPSGHLMVVTGFARAPDGSFWVHVNDPADHDPAASMRRYPLHELERYFSGVGYAIERAP